jgi:hypothetical protein
VSTLHSAKLPFLSGEQMPTPHRLIRGTAQAKLIENFGCLAQDEI